MRKKKVWIPVRVFATACAVLGWWGILYPELTMTPDTYRIVCEDDVSGEECVQEAGMGWNLNGDIYGTVLGAKRSQKRFRSRLLMNVSAWYEQERGVNEAE